MTEAGNVTPDWWFWKYFGTVELSDTNLGSLGITLLSDYENGSDPNVIIFLLSVTNNYVNNTPSRLHMSLSAGTPG